MAFIYWILAFTGHVGLWCATFNWLHSTALRRWARKGSEIVVLIALVLPVAFLVWQSGKLLLGGCEPITFSGGGIGGRFYLAVSCVLAVPTVGLWVFRKFAKRRQVAAVTSVVRSVTKLKDTHEKPLLHGQQARLLGLFPFNEALQLSTDRITLQLDVPGSIDGLRIAQLSDFHLTGNLDLKFFQHAVELANEFDPDLIVLSGDLIDHRECLDWIEPVFGELRAKHGVFYVLGNHDLRVRDEEELRHRLHAAGLIRLGGNWQSVQYNGATIQLAGNELPWFQGAEYLPLSDAEPAVMTANDLKSANRDALRILVSHSPDQLGWAKPYDFDLMFAGHTHGGQIAFPLIGPIIAPSKYGVRYAGGTFQVGSMLMHVSRGLSGDKPIRWNSRPELGLFTIEAKKE